MYYLEAELVKNLVFKIQAWVWITPATQIKNIELAFQEGFLGRR